jgi:oxalate---CoA ligase
VDRLQRNTTKIVSKGFANPTRRDRRFFNGRIRELIKDNVIEKVIVPKLYGSSSALCIRLVGDSRTEGTEGVVVQSGDVGDEEQQEETSDDMGEF